MIKPCLAMYAKDSQKERETYWIKEIRHWWILIMAHPEWSWQTEEAKRKMKRLKDGAGSIPGKGKDVIREIYNCLSPHYDNNYNQCSMQPISERPICKNKNK